MRTLSEIIIFLEEYCGVKSITPDKDIFGEVGIVGDDFHEMIEIYAEQYAVDMTNYIWYFHCDEEGFSIGCSICRNSVIRFLTSSKC